MSEAPKKLSFGLLESHCIAVWHAPVTITVSDYPELDGMTEQEMNENETMWAEEQGDAEQAPVEDPNLRSVGISPGGIAGDLEAVEPLPAEGQAPPGQMQGMSPMGGPQPGAAAGVAAAPAGGVPA